MSHTEQEKITIEIMQDGPLIIKGLDKITDSKGNAIDLNGNAALCRCGASSNKPFCDGSHSSIGYSGERETKKPLTKERAYTGEQITIHDNRVICSHAKTCVQELASVFRFGERPWIEPDGAEPEAIIDVVKKCPSGALSYSIDGVHHRDFFDRDPGIGIVKDGPYNVVGGIHLEVDENLQPPTSEHYSICRCGASKNKPYCDGSHSEIDFKG